MMEKYILLNLLLNVAAITSEDFRIFFALYSISISIKSDVKSQITDFLCLNLFEISLIYQISYMCVI